MQKLLYYFSIVSLLLVFACKKDEDENRCGEVNCKNGAACVDNRCDCPPNYTGLDCGQQITPSEIRIKKIQLSQWPQLSPDGEDWDESPCFGPLPDLFFTINYGNGQAAETAYFSEAKADTTYTFTDNFPLITSDVSTELSLTLQDRDTGFCFPSDTLGTVKTQLYTSTNDFPATLEFSDKSVPIKATVFLEYEF